MFRFFVAVHFGSAEYHLIHACALCCVFRWKRVISSRVLARTVVKQTLVLHKTGGMIQESFQICSPIEKVLSFLAEKKGLQ